MCLSNHQSLQHLVNIHPLGKIVTQMFCPREAHVWIGDVEPGVRLPSFGGFFFSGGRYFRGAKKVI